MGLLRDYLQDRYKQGQIASENQAKLEQITTEHDRRAQEDYANAQYRSGLAYQQHIQDLGLEGVKQSNVLEKEQTQSRNRILEANAQSRNRIAEAANQQALDIAKKKDLYWYDMGEDALQGVMNIAGSVVKGVVPTWMSIEDKGSERTWKSEEAAKDRASRRK